MKRILCFAALIVPVAAAALAAPAGKDVLVLDRDVDRDGARDLTLQNEHIRVVLHSGEVPTSAASGYSKTRFAWGGWIRELTYLPTAREFFHVPRLHGRGFTLHQGQPEEFEQLIPLGTSTTTPNGEVVDDLLKIGTGLCRGTRVTATRWKELEPVIPAPWQVGAIENENGARTLVFTQEVEPVQGYGYRYEKRFTLEPRSSSLKVMRTLTNTGSNTLSTTWSLHPFLAQDDGNVAGTNCWSTTPMLTGGHPCAVDTTPCTPFTSAPINFRGALAGRNIAEPWLANGNRQTKELLVTRVGQPMPWCRLSTRVDRYSVAPFAFIDLEPGGTWRSPTTHTVYRGLDAVTAAGDGTAIKLTRERKKLTVELLSDSPLRAATVELTVKHPESGKTLRKRRAVLSELGPETPRSTTFSLRRKSPVSVVIWVTDPDTGKLLLGCERYLDRTEPAPPPAPPYRVLILAESLNGEGKPQNDIAGLIPILKADGATVRRVDLTDDSVPEAAWNRVDCVVVAGDSWVSEATALWLRDYVEHGGGLFQGAPLALAGSPAADLLPVTFTGTNFNAGFTPDDSARNTGELGRHRLHLLAAEPDKVHPLTAGILLWPAADQDIGVATGVKAVRKSSVILLFADGGEAGVLGGTPALVTGRNGKGRVAALAAPLLWGSPPEWINAAHMGEYHRELLLRIVRWTAGVDAR